MIFSWVWNSECGPWRDADFQGNFILYSLLHSSYAFNTTIHNKNVYCWKPTLKPEQCETYNIFLLRWIIRTQLRFILVEGQIMKSWNIFFFRIINFAESQQPMYRISNNTHYACYNVIVISILQKTEFMRRHSIKKLMGTMSNWNWKWVQKSALE